VIEPAKIDDVTFPPSGEGVPEPWFRHAVPFLAPLLLVCLFVAASQLSLVLERGRGAIIVTAAVLVTALGAIASFYLARSWRHSIPPAVLCLGAFGFVLIVESGLARYGITLAVAVLVAAFLSRLERHGEGAELSGADNERLVMMLLAPAAFFMLSFAFAAVEITSVPAWQMAGPVALLAAFIIGEMTWRAAPDKRLGPLIPATAAVLAAEIFIALSVLPVRHVVNGAVAAILLSLVAHKVRDELESDSNPLQFRRHAALSVLLVVIILVTAQWL